MFSWRKPNTAWWILNSLILLGTGVAYGDGAGVITVQQQTFTEHLKTYAQVEPVAVLPVRSGVTGTLTGLDILPGAGVRPGQTLAELGGPEIEARLVKDKGAVRYARVELGGAQKLLAIRRHRLKSHLSDQQDVLQARSALARARAALDTAQAQLRALRRLTKLKAPVGGMVLSVDGADGQRVKPGDAILTLQPDGGLWLKAVFYGADAAALHMGMTGQFTPADGGDVIAVRVGAIFSSLNSDGGRAAGLFATTRKPGWLNGASGTVALNGATHAMVAVPTRALILDRGKWWVLVRTKNQDLPQAVVPGPTRGWRTFVEAGLKPGMEVVVENAYLRFHRSISHYYQPPD